MRPNSDPSGPLGEVIRRFFTAPAQAQEQAFFLWTLQALPFRQLLRCPRLPGTGNRAPSPSLPSVADLWEERAPLMSDGEFMQAVYAAGSYGETIRRLYDFGDWSGIKGTYQGAPDDSQSVGDWALGKALLAFSQDWGQGGTPVPGFKTPQNRRENRVSFQTPERTGNALSGLWSY